ncbi:hypothetical protein [Paraburkholderia lacunae]|uniref:hypothetical protein n=1 Tax=Paraburkholderia lacunae TaxID=2211104 RepID=UPI0010584562|nr:hypothetical protein [Paraburkholderia lacunae]
MSSPVGKIVIDNHNRILHARARQRPGVRAHPFRDVAARRALSMTCGRFANVAHLANHRA